MTKAEKLAGADTKGGKYQPRGSATSVHESEGWGHFPAVKVSAASKKIYGMRRQSRQSTLLVDPEIAAKALSQLIDGRLTRDDVRTVIADRTLERRVAEGKNLSVDEADAIIRLLRVTEAARRLFENDERADHWLRNINPALGGAIPIRVARTDVGGRAVEQVLGRLEYGVYS